MCKLTDHVKNNSRDIDDDAQRLKAELMEKITTTVLSLSKLNRMQENLKVLKYESYQTNEAKLTEIQAAKAKLQQLIDMGALEPESVVSEQYDRVKANIVSSVLHKEIDSILAKYDYAC